MNIINSNIEIILCSDDWWPASDITITTAKYLILLSIFILEHFILIRQVYFQCNVNRTYSSHGTFFSDWGKSCSFLAPDSNRINHSSSASKNDGTSHFWVTATTKRDEAVCVDAAPRSRDIFPTNISYKYLFISKLSKQKCQK